MIASQNKLNQFGASFECFRRDSALDCLARLRGVVKRIPSTKSGISES